MTPTLPQPTAPRLIGRANDVWALEKPSGWVVHATSEHETHCLLQWAKKTGLPATLAPLHRLDRGTSGVVLFAAAAAVRRRVGTQLARGELEKRYRALVLGRTRRKGIIRRPLVERGKKQPSLTRWRSVERLGGFTLLEVRPATGRKHQVRQHLHGIGHSIVGDDRYRPKRFVAVPAFPERLWLHATSIVLPDGTRFESPLPADLEAHLETLRAHPAVSEPRPPVPKTPPDHE